MSKVAGSNPYAKAVGGAQKHKAKASKLPQKSKAAPSTASNGGPERHSVRRDTLRDDILALGGSEEELRMLLEVESGSELEGEEEELDSGKSKTKQGGRDAALVAELRSLIKADGSASTAFTAPDDNFEDEDDSEEDEDVAVETVRAERNEAQKIEQPTGSSLEEKAKKETKHEREERRKKERQAEKEKEQAQKALLKEEKAVIKPIKSKSPWIVDPAPQWYSTPLPGLAALPKPSSTVISNLQARATSLLETENSLYSSSLSPQASSSSAPPPNGLSKSDQVFIQQILTSGTSTDRISALLLLVSSAPLHTMSYLEQLATLSKKKSRDESGRVIRGLVDWWRGQGGGAPDRKLRTFADQPGLGAVAEALGPAGSGKQAEDERNKEFSRCLVLWAYEDWLKKWFFDVLKSLEQMSTDPLPHPRSLAVIHLSNLLRDKPEQEGNILRLLVNKLGDSQRSIASKTSHHLLQVLQYHPGMTPILVREVASLILRPTIPAGHVRFGEKAAPKAKDLGQDHARYYGVITLNQVVLARDMSETAVKMIEVYFQIFGDILGRLPDEDAVKDDTAKPGNQKRKRSGGGGKREKRKEGDVDETDSKLVAAVLTGVNRAFPFAKLDDEAIQKRLDTLYRITHTGTFNVSIQALMLIYHVSAAKRAVSDRFYRTLYASLHDYRLAGSSKQALYLNLVLKALKSDPSASRVAAFIKRLMQIMLGMDVTFILGSLWIVGELTSTVPGLRKILSKPEATLLATASASSGSAAQPEARGTAYDGTKRDPVFANAQNSCLWEIVPLVNHFHPSVALAARHLLDGEPMSASTDLEQHTLNHFLDRFVYREARKAAVTKGASMMQSGVAGQDRSGRIVMVKGPTADTTQVNSDAFKNKRVDKVPVDQLFFHKYFSTQTSKEDEKVKASAKRKPKKGKGEDEDSDEESIADIGFSDVDEEDEDAARQALSDEDDSTQEEEVWKAMKASMPKDGGDDDMGDDMGSDEEDDIDPAEFDYSDSEPEAGEAGGVSAKSAFPAEGEEEDEDEDDDFEGLLEEDEDLIGSDEDMPMFGSEDDEGASGKTQGGRDKKKRKLKHLPTFATAEDYAHLLGDSDDDDV